MCIFFNSHQLFLKKVKGQKVMKRGRKKTLRNFVNKILRNISLKSI